MALKIERLHGFGVAAFVRRGEPAGFVAGIVGPPFRGALHGTDAPCDHGDLSKADHDGGGDLSVDGPKAGAADGEGGGFVLGRLLLCGR